MGPVGAYQAAPVTARDGLPLRRSLHCWSMRHHRPAPRPEGRAALRLHRCPQGSWSRPALLLPQAASCCAQAGLPRPWHAPHWAAGLSRRHQRCFVGASPAAV
eukprot:366318-Chlamydomonas_euryale.AAC.9